MKGTQNLGILLSLMSWAKIWEGHPPCSDDMGSLDCWGFAEQQLSFLQQKTALRSTVDMDGVSTAIPSTFLPDEGADWTLGQVTGAFSYSKRSCTMAGT